MEAGGKEFDAQAPTYQPFAKYSERGILVSSEKIASEVYLEQSRCLAKMIISGCVFEGISRRI